MLCQFRHYRREKLSPCGKLDGRRPEEEDRETRCATAVWGHRVAVVGVPPSPNSLSRLGVEHQLLHSPVQQLADPEHVLGWAGDLVDPAELLQLFAAFAEHTQHSAVER